MSTNLELLTRDELLDYARHLEGQIEKMAEAVPSEGKISRLHKEFGLTLAEARLLLILADGRTYSREALLSRMYFDRPVVIRPHIKIVDVRLCRVRAKLQGSGISITTQWGTGYSVSGLDVLEGILSGEQRQPLRRAA